MRNNLVVGQKVVCVDAKPTVWFPDIGLVENVIYTITEVGPDWVKIAEVNHPFCTVGFWAARFKPAHDKKTDISIFQKMLKEKRVSEDV